MLLVILIILALTIFAIVFVQQGRRNVPVLFPGRRVGNRMSMPVRSNLPLMVNMAGMIPLIFAQAILTFPAIVASYFVSSADNLGGEFCHRRLQHISMVRVWSMGCCTSSWWLRSPSSTPMCSSPSRTMVIT